MTGIDFFDVDHTLTRHSSGRRFMTIAMRQSVLPRRLLGQMLWYSLLYRLGWFRSDAFRRGFPSLRGATRATLERVARESFQVLKQDIFPRAIELLKERKAGGRRVVLATSSLDIIVQPLAEFLGVDGVLATELEFREEACTGRFLGAPMFRDGKRERVLSFLAREGVRASDSSFYSDSIYDLPLLESVGNPVAVNPDFRLRRIARRRGWQILVMDARGAPPASASPG